jgi:arabinofuranan 3-O-arabinosyltransferase
MTLRSAFRRPVEPEPEFDVNEVTEFAAADSGAALADTGASDAAVEDRMGRLGLLFAAAGALALAFIQQPGNVVDDTKLPLVMSPLAFMANSLHLWNPALYSGSVQTATYGYLVPMGPFFGLGEALHVPVWITERVWLALLLTVSFWGIVRLAEALGIKGRGAKVAGAVAYTIAPTVVTNTATSAALLAVVLLPWVLVPLVRGAAGGSPRRAAAASGIAIALMGGVNATVVLVTLPVPVIWLLTRQSGPRRRALMGWWIVAVGLACFWWASALYLQGRYGYNYLPYTETSPTTTATASLFEAVRGASFWIGYFTLGGQWSPGTWALISMVPAIIGTAVVAALGLVGLAWRGIPERRFLVITLFVGVLAIAGGYDGSLGAPVAHTVQTLLQHPFALLRNISKFSPDVALPLALGLAWFVSTIRWRLLAGRARAKLRVPRAVVNWGLLVVVTGALVAASAPFWQSKLYPAGGFSAIPSYWSSAARWLDAHQSHGTALLVPGAEFARYTWGIPLDEPLSVDLSSNWSVRSIVPFGSNGNDQVLDTVESSLDQGVVAPGMADYLARAGFNYVVERNDLNLRLSGAPPPAQVHQVLSETPGLQQVATFGPVISRTQASWSSLSAYDSLTANRNLRSVVIYRVVPATTVVRTYPTSDPVVVSGSPGSLLPLVAAGTLDHRAAILAGDPYGGSAAAKAVSATWADTDGNQRRDQAFGLIRNNFSYVLGPNQRSSVAEPGVPQNLAVVPGESHQTVADPLGAASVSASSFGSTALALQPTQGPAAAFSTLPGTEWIASDADNSVGQWVQIDFRHPINLNDVVVLPVDFARKGPQPTAITLTTSNGSVRRHIKQGFNTVKGPSGSSRWLRITLARVRPGRTPAGQIAPGVGLKVGVEGITFQLALRLPSDETSAFSHPGSKTVEYSFNAPLANGNLDLNTPSDDDPQMIRRFTVPRTTTVRITGAVTPIPGPALDPLLPNVVSDVSVSASSTLQDLPRFGPDNLLSDSGRPWIADLGDKAPSLTFTWAHDRSVSSIVLKTTSQASTARQVEISGSSGRAVTVNVPKGGGVISFPPLFTNKLVITFVKVTGRYNIFPAYDEPFIVPVGVQSLTIPALTTVPASVPLSTPISLPCGKGPALKLDGSTLRTAVSGTVGEADALTPMTLTVCGPVPLARGNHLLEAPVSGAFKVSSLMAQPIAPTATLPQRPAKIVGPWTAQHRTVRVGAGASSYLVVAQNFNTGWKATLGGQPLTPVRVDGWQQAWIVPAGAGGDVQMDYAPNAVYHLGLLLGAVFLLCLALLALVKGRKHAQPPAVAERLLPALAVAVVGFVALVLLVGPLALVLLPLLVVARTWGRNVTAVVAGAAFLSAGIAVALSPGAEPMTGSGAFGPVPQACAAIALAAVLASLIVGKKRGDKPTNITPVRQEPTPRAVDHQEPDAPLASIGVGDHGEEEGPGGDRPG